MFGLNYLFISPYKIPASKLADATPTDYMVAEPHTFAEADDPANTVFYTVSDRGYIPTTTTDVIGTLDATRGFWAVDAPGVWTALVASNQLAIQQDGVEVRDPSTVRTIMTKAVDASLVTLARAGLYPE